MSSFKKNLLTKINSGQALIGVIGLGYVGLPLVLRFVEENYPVLGFDVDHEKIQTLNKGQSYIQHIAHEAILQANQKRFCATADFSRSKDADVLIICVPTPLNKQREPDLSFVFNTMDALVPHLRSGQMVSLESTTYPGTTEEVLLPRIESTGLKVGKDIFLVFSPEREDPCNLHFTTRTIPKVCGGYTSSCLKIGVALYSKIIDQVVPVSSTKAAEMTKLLENIHRAVNIGLVNEMKVVADKMGIDIYEVIRAASTKPFGFVPYYPGPGLGGHCIPIDPFYLTWKAREFGLHTKFIELAGEVNASMPDFVIQKTCLALNQQQKSLKNSRLLVLGLAYKKNIDDMRESPSVVIIEKLLALGATVNYSDPYIPIFPKMREHHLILKSVPLTAKTLASYDGVLLLTDHDNFDYAFILAHASLIIDTRGRYLPPAKHVVQA